MSLTSNILAHRNEAKDNQAAMIMSMETKLNAKGWGLYKYLNRGDRKTSKISVAQYWDWLTYIDDDYLTDYEVLKMKELYYWQM